MEMKWFDIAEFDCQETDENEMKATFLLMYDRLRDRCGFPFVVTSGYRSETHTKERDKAKPGTHTQGIAADTKILNGLQRMRIVREALELGFTGIGIAKTFVHVDRRKTTPVIWTY